MACKICGGITTQTQKSGEQCTNCGSIFASKLPTNETLSKYYSEFNNNYHGGGRQKKSIDRQTLYAKKYLDIVKKYSTGKTIIDIGSSTNPFPNLIAISGYHTTVLDYIKPKNLLNEVNFIEGAIDNENFELKNTKFCTVTAFAVVEHCKNPITAINNLAKLCSPGGHIILTTPEIGCFADRHALGFTPWFFPPEHLHIISKLGLIKIFEDANCNLIKSARFELNTFRWIARYGLGFVEGVTGWTIHKFNKLYWEEKRQTRTTLNQGITLIIFKKNV